MLFTFIGAFLGLTCGLVYVYLHPKKIHNMSDLAIAAGTVIFTTLVGTGFGAGFGLKALSDGSHPLL
jgi:hypothetical protein